MFNTVILPWFFPFFKHESLIYDTP